MITEIKEIKNEAKKFDILESELKDLQQLKKRSFLTTKQKNIIFKRIDEIKKVLGIGIETIEYSIDDIRNAKKKEMLIDKLVGRSSLIVLVGAFGTGKSTLAKYIYITLLKNNPDIYIRYLDFDNPIESLQNYKIDQLQEKYGERFRYFGKRNPLLDIDMTNEGENVIQNVIEEQVANPKKIYILFEDNLKNIARKNHKGLIDPRHIWKLEKKFQVAGGTVIALHHTNKSGVFADTTDIMNFADISFNIYFNDSTSSIIVEPDKQSRFFIEAKAFKVDPKTREIIEEIDYKVANVSKEEIKIVNTIKEILNDCGDLNQSELEKEIKPLRIVLGMGEKKFRAILKKHSGTSWLTNRCKNNALIFSTLDTKSTKVPNQKNPQGK